MERETGFEPATFCLGSRYSTAELLPQLRTCHDETINANHKQVNPTPPHDKDLCKTYSHREQSLVNPQGGELTWIGMERQCRVSFGYGCLDCVVRVQSVTWAAVVGCPCDWWWWLFGLAHPLLPVSGTGTGFDSSPIKGEGDWWVCLVVTPPCGYCLKASMTGRPAAPVD